MKCTQVLEKVVYDSWYAHECGKPNAGDWVRTKLPRRAHMCVGVASSKKIGTCIAYLAEP